MSKCFYLFVSFSLVITAMFGQCPGATTYYVAPNGNDNNPGTVTQPFASMHHVLKVLQAGDVAIFEDGNYSEAELTQFSNGGTANCPIVVKARNKHQAKITFITYVGQDTTTHKGPSLRIYQPYITIEGFDLSKDVKFPSTSNQIIRIYGRTDFNENGNYVTIRDNIIHNAFEEGVKSHKTTGILVENNIIYDFVHEGIDFVTVDRSIIRGNEIYDVERMGILSGKGAIASKSIEVYNNYIHISKPMLSCCGYGITLGGHGAVIVNGSVNYNTEISNYNSVAYNNVIVSDPPGLINRGLGAAGTKDCAFYNNVVIGAKVGAYGRTFYGQSGNNAPVNHNENLIIKNNIFSNTTDRYYHFWPGNITGTPDFDYNLFTGAVNPSIPASAPEANSIYNLDPLFVNNSSDWHFQSSSPAIDEGIASTFIGYFNEIIDISKDRDGLNRVAPWDMGVFEFNANQCPAINASTVITNESAPNANDGSVDLTPSGGTLPYTFSWSTGANTEDLNNLSGGYYTVTITDANGCVSTSFATVNTTPPQGCAGGITYYVAPNGSDNNPGTAAQPFASMYKVAQVIRAGETAIFTDGNYTEPKRVEFVNGGTEDCPIILQAQNQHQAKIVFTTGSQSAQSIWINKPWIIIDGFDLSKEVVYSTPSNQVVRVYGNSSNNGHYCTIKNNRIHNAFGAGIKSYQTLGLTIDNNILFDFVDDAIDLVEIDSSIISNNEVYNVQRHGIMIGGGSKSGQVFNNYVHYDGACCMDGYGIFFGSDPEFGTIQCLNSVAYNNVVVSSTPGAMKGGMCMSSSTDCSFNNNVIVGPENGRYFTTVQATPFKSIGFKNNIVMNCSQMASAGSILMADTPDFNHNCYYNNGSSPIELNSIYTDPQFVDPLSDWILVSTSPAIDRGTAYQFTGHYGEPIDVTNAYDGTPRTINWDMGVYESPSSSVYVKPDIRLWLEGVYDHSTSKMRSDLIDFTPFPNVQPYQAAPWNYPGTEGTGWGTNDYPTNTVDWVKVEFRSSTDPLSEVSSTAALLLDDGSLYFPNVEALTINQGNSYYIVVEHRNHMAVMTPTSVPIVGNTIFYDFRGADSYSTIGVGQKELYPNVWAMIAGDGNQVADITGYDVNTVDIILWNQENGTFNTYSQSDFNMDGDVSALDKILWSINNGLFSSVRK